jgi:MHS family proline/betaine transporter-like MFS transporter
MPSVDTAAEARELVATQDTNPLLDVDSMPLPLVPVPAQAGGRRLEPVAG